MLYLFTVIFFVLGKILSQLLGIQVASEEANKYHDSKDQSPKQ